MYEEKYEENANVVRENTFHGVTQIAEQIINNAVPQENLVENSKSKSEPLWRSNIMLAVLAWLGVVIGIIGIIC